MTATNRTTYDANGMRLSKSEGRQRKPLYAGRIACGNIAGLEIRADAARRMWTKRACPLNWTGPMTEYLYDLDTEYHQVISETTTSLAALLLQQPMPMA